MSPTGARRSASKTSSSESAGDGGRQPIARSTRRGPPGGRHRPRSMTATRRTARPPRAASSPGARSVPARRRSARRRTSRARTPAGASRTSRPRRPARSRGYPTAGSRARRVSRVVRPTPGPRAGDDQRDPALEEHPDRGGQLGIERPIADQRHDGPRLGRERAKGPPAPRRATVGQWRLRTRGCRRRGGQRTAEPGERQTPQSTVDPGPPGALARTTFPVGAGRHGP